MINIRSVYRVGNSRRLKTALWVYESEMRLGKFMRPAHMWYVTYGGAMQRGPKIAGGPGYFDLLGHVHAADCDLRRILRRAEKSSLRL